MTNPTQDRNYYRMLDDEDLIDLAKETDNELALVLAERLKKLKNRAPAWADD